MTPKQRTALECLAKLTELGRAGLDWAPQCSYGVEGTDNGIQLFQMGVTDSDMKHFDVLPDWQAITLRENAVTDKGFRHLSNQKDLEFLDIAETRITTLDPIKGAVNLQQLWCDQLDKLSDRKAVALGGFKKLEFLDLCWTDIGDATAKRISGLPNLRRLNLIGTKITDDGLQFLAKLPRLENLGLYRTTIGDEGIRHLHGMRQLRLITVGETHVTSKGTKDLKRENPDLKVVDYGQI